MARKEYAWAAKLANQVYILDNQDRDARQLKADALRQMACVSTGANDRAHLLSQALALEGKTTIARLVPPTAAAIAASPSTYVDYFRVRIDPTKSDATDAFVRFDFADGTQAGLHVRRAVAEYVPVPDRYGRKPDFILAMSGETWARLYLSQASVVDVIREGDIRRHSACLPGTRSLTRVPCCSRSVCSIGSRQRRAGAPRASERAHIRARGIAGPDCSRLAMRSAVGRAWAKKRLRPGHR